MTTNVKNSSEGYTDPLLTPEQVAEALGVSLGTLQNWRCSGAYPLRFCKLGRRLVRYRRSDVEHFVASQLSPESPKILNLTRGGQA